MCTPQPLVSVMPPADDLNGDGETRTAICGDLSYPDVCVALAMLKALRLPTELALQILELACYWPCCTFEMHGNRTARAARGAAKICLDAGVMERDILRKLGSSKLKVNEIVFEFDSHDQGWTSEGTEGMP
jgi:hypothetical protein